MKPMPWPTCLWFATGGGKTEAYLGLTAYTLALRRLQGEIEGRRGDHGIAVLMRYTLRLLTLQQFQRAAALICACETIRRADVGKWGETPFRLGLWVGNKTTPNTLAAAANALRQRNVGGRPSSTGTRIRSLPAPGAAAKSRNSIFESMKRRATLGAALPTAATTWVAANLQKRNAPKEGLPVMVVDEEIYRRPPSLLIATVDKFAQMPWKGETQMLFGKVTKCATGMASCRRKLRTGNHTRRGMVCRRSRTDPMVSCVHPI